LLWGERHLPDEEATHRLAAEWAAGRRAGEALLLSGLLGAGKTSFVRGVLRALGWEGPVRSPSFSLLLPYPTDPPVLHADLYRVESAEGLGLEDYWDSHLCLIEWGERMEGPPHERCWELRLEIDGEGRRSDLRPLRL
jgi:tRNA threonylcarbamoyladenosine biosynthesis protein TsaE